MRLVNFHLGGALYTMPGIFRLAGVQNGCFMVVMFGLVSLLVYEYIARTAVAIRQGSLGRIVAELMGSSFGALVRVLAVLNTLCVVSAYIKTTTDTMLVASNGEPFSLTALSTASCSCFVGVIVAGLALTLALEVLLPRYADWASVTANAVCVANIIVLLAYPKDPLVTHSAPTRPVSWVQVGLECGPSIVFAFRSAEYVLCACDVSDDQGMLKEGVSSEQLFRRVRTVGALSAFLSSAVYILVGYAGLCAFGSDVKDDILMHFQSPTLGSGAVLGANVLSLLLSVPVYVENMLVYVRELVWDTLATSHSTKHAGKHSRLSPMLASAWIVPLLAVVVKTCPGLWNLVSLLGAATDYHFMYMFPPVAFAFSISLAKATMFEGILWVLALPLSFLASMISVVEIEAVLERH
eukprot:TRINITY_DN10801_c0_g1_i1.p1 TRINITY_DN10801_c0_g1~~TRINITY_DN10801_c0_g1_i1.p1  ORF type:complete len:409 (-),score=48.85 TRINITY_DN10801_c0_g1_i1:16-1242(-)